NIEKSPVEDDSSAFDPLPDDLVLQIIRKILVMPAIRSLQKFKGLKSLCIHIPASPKYPYPVKWKIIFGKKLDSLLFLSPNLVYRSKECVDENSHEEEDTELNREKYYTAMSRLDDAVMSHVILLNCIARIPLLEKVTLTDSLKTCRISIDAEKIAEMRKGLTLLYELVRRNRVRKCYVPLLV
ncbi:hypothetical protein Tco_1324462, partial [Tanacetum coccineum]